MEHFDYSDRYLRLLSQKFRTVQEVSTELINLEAILALPKGTEHFMSDIHGEDEAFAHILNNCSGVVRDKIDAVYGDTLTAGERARAGNPDLLPRAQAGGDQGTHDRRPGRLVPASPCDRLIGDLPGGGLQIHPFQGP